jgi:histidine triad (HIT) family protein
MDSCAFCDVVTGRRAQEMVYASETVVAFLCEPPASWGHTLIVPRAHRQDIWTIEVEEAVEAMNVARRLARAMRDELQAVGIHLRQNSGERAGQEVLHFHLHVIPRYEDDTVLPGCVWGVPPWQPPTGGAVERKRVGSALRRGLGGDI